MIVNEEFLSKLRRSFNLNLYEVKLWTALLSRGVSTAGELSDIADVPRSRTYDVLESLERKGFVIVKPEKPIKYMAISPGEVLARVKNRISIIAKERSDRLEKLSDSDILKELEMLFKQGIEPMQPTDFSGALKGRHNLYDHLAMLCKEAQKSIYILTTEDGLIRKVRTIKPLLEKAKARGVEIKIGAPVTTKTKEVIDRLQGIAEVRNIPNVSARVCLIDSKQIMFMLIDDKDVHPTYDIGLWVNTPFFATAINNMFVQAWAGGNSNLIQSASPEIKTDDIILPEEAQNLLD
ncbi:TrmB family transcriptional regulator [Candidatus Woesearchaeota archaeon]|jgi:HTH-type transcriptional regulator, sugar sensing transcriptional regulator|nr:TrmB family transcriptional regulator [Candidatus Woesearchaeota archaeon]MBT4114719.1 TrmB family transcriptional regulator [Candidatus Woesearchaeota archaeon]